MGGWASGCFLFRSLFKFFAQDQHQGCVCSSSLVTILFLSIFVLLQGSKMQAPQGRARAMPAVAEAAEQLSREAEDLLRGVFVARRVVSCYVSYH